nr:hypothetical protein [uncultured Cupriavidus sp.]
MEEIGAALKSTPSTGLFHALRNAGREAVDSWLSEYLRYEGERSTFIVEKEIKPSTQGSAAAIQTLNSVKGTAGYCSTVCCGHGILSFSLLRLNPRRPFRSAVKLNKVSRS